MEVLKRPPTAPEVASVKASKFNSIVNKYVGRERLEVIVDRNCDLGSK